MCCVFVLMFGRHCSRAPGYTSPTLIYYTTCIYPEHISPLNLSRSFSRSLSMTCPPVRTSTQRCRLELFFCISLPCARVHNKRRHKRRKRQSGARELATYVYTIHTRTHAYSHARARKLAMTTTYGGICGPRRMRL